MMLKKVCSSCGKDRKRNKLAYDANLNPYCKYTHECNSDHVNSTMNLIKNGKLITLYDHDKALEIFAQNNTNDTIKHMASPITIRLSDVRQAIHIENVCAERNISTSDYIRRLIEQDMQTIEVEPKQEPIAPKETDEGELTF